MKSVSEGGAFWRNVTRSLRWVGLFLVAPVSVYAAPEFSVSAPSKLKEGESLAIEVTLSEAVGKLSAELSDVSSRKSLTKKQWSRAKAGKVYRVKHRLKAGQHRLTLQLSARLGNDESRISFPLEVLVVSPLSVRVTKAGLDPRAGRLTLHAKGILASATIEVFDETGAQLDSVTTDLTGDSNTGRVELNFTPVPDEKIFRLELSVSDAAGQWRRFKFVRWHADIPHEDVIFENGQWQIPKREHEKLNTAINALNTEVTRFRETVGRADVDFDVSLYVGGMTDTVGTKRDNQRLSFKRARAIASYFRQRGLKMPIFVAGFGESGLRVATPDEVAEPKNRRAIYVLTSGTTPNLTPPSGQWQKY
ncbi:MAG: OmpA family protein [Bradymonadia bacterium]